MNLGGNQLIDLKDEVLSSFRPMENLFKILGWVSMDESGETAQLCSEIGLELARSFRAKLDAALESLTAEARHG